MVLNDPPEQEEEQRRGEDGEPDDLHDRALAVPAGRDLEPADADDAKDHE